jgi:hypothetical protein
MRSGGPAAREADRFLPQDHGTPNAFVQQNWGLCGQRESEIPFGLMNSYTNPYTVGMVSESPEAVRAEFIRLTYFHLAGAIALFAILEGLFLQMGWGVAAHCKLLGTGRYLLAHCPRRIHGCLVAGGPLGDKRMRRGACNTPGWPSTRWRKPSFSCR